MTRGEFAIAVFGMLVLSAVFIITVFIIWRSSPQGVCLEIAQSIEDINECKEL